MTEIGRIQIDRLIIENFRSIRHCDVRLGPLTFLVGRNGSGKSSFIDAIQFIRTALKKGVADALSERNGLTTVLHRPCPFPAQIELKLWFSGSQGLSGCFELQIAVVSWNEWSVSSEVCQVRCEGSGFAEYRLEKGVLAGNVEKLPPPPQDRLYLSAVSGFDAFGPVYKMLTDLLVSEYSPKGIHLLLLNVFPKSYNFPSEVRSLVNGDPDRRRVVEDYLRLMVPNFLRLELESAGDREWVAFVEKVDDLERRFFVTQVSDGTLYATEIMLDLFVRRDQDG